VQSSKIAKRYAKALIGLGSEDGNLELYDRELAEFLEAWQAYAELRLAVLNPVFPLGDRKRILEKVLAQSRFSKTMEHFLNLLLEKSRLDRVAEIRSHYEQLKDEILNVTRAEVLTARPLKEEAQLRLNRVLEAFKSQKVKMDIREDKSLIGGIIVKINDLVLDASIKSQLRGWRESLKERVKV